MPGIQRLPGMRDDATRGVERREAAKQSLQGYLASRGFRPIDTPLLEPTELFLRKSGGALASRMYTFTDPGGNRVSLRPEFTSSAIRHYLERADEEPLPALLQYAGPVFRYDTIHGSNQFDQVGAEIIGSPAPDSDGEVLAMAAEGLQLRGVVSPQCVVGHVGVLHLMLEEMGLSRRARDFLIANLPRLKQTPEERHLIREQAQTLGLMHTQEHPVSQALAQTLDGAEARALLIELFQGSHTDVVGSRSIEEILDRFLAKAQRGDNPQRIETGIDLFSRLAAVRGPEEQAMGEIRSALRESGISVSVLKPLEQVLASLHVRSPSVAPVVDIGLVRGLAYYTGMVFDVVATDPGGTPRTVCGGGRYDGLVRALGGVDDVPALGFAYNVENLLHLLPEDPEAKPSYA